MCCGSGGGYSSHGWGQASTPGVGASVWRLEVSEHEDPLPNGERHQDFMTWVEADAARARLGRGRYFEHRLTQADITTA
ncbi:hypothetical protein RCO28_27580 [Streptomyces sp. LHD-70]|uniref:hypothetical protein n=1 Tax=Streptomyces sp. LHD-70 TaxID=3072140 RepID=UPI0028104F30|nr:hypothetical protein [Streptomyces sp. LHD-70]MDQ8706202.1 hypothetical protein [Streptomyces sp. LHD-70]